MSEQVFETKMISYWLISHRQITASDLKAFVIKNCRLNEILHTYTAVF